MLIRAGYNIRLETAQPTPLLALLSVHPSRNKDLVTLHRITATPDVPMYNYVDGFGNICTRLTVPEGGVTLDCDFVIRDTGAADIYAPDAPQLPIEQLPDDVLVYLLGSRYCETDRLSETAWGLFGHIRPGWDRVQAIVDFTHDHIEFGYHHARHTKTAWDAHQEQTGVCRDFAHLAIALCRCMNIPARYCTGYLGEIREPRSEAAMDFSAWFDVYLGGNWYTFDARHNRPRIGRILMARGRDATDAALTTSFGPAALTRFDVITEEVSEAGAVV
ncbi:transglutaminase-like putative cysteine protease [Sphingomonas jejuensis]|uniref:Transglutaminase-like putative cysteine protease n=1 Tax=Sphingomonas jejuensis TaxID=904715 RepID=A0ABX0XKV9_9SPHN|nr:transglutaminase family protein [Sphingomonas jejuensis]NJC34001.1 transglutaminase-like putative cysteine protease [Sphingomonas jejuensis]